LTRSRGNNPPTPPFVQHPEAVVDNLRHDMRLAVRSIRRAPAFALASIATLALGIGATTAIFSVVDAALLEPPPYPEPDRILVLGRQDGQTFHYVRERARGFQRIAAHGGSSGWNLLVGDHAEYVRGVPVSEGFFDVLGTPPLLGRDFSRVEDQANGPRVVVVSEQLWRRLLGARPDAIGKVVELGGVPHSIVGVMPAGLRTVPPADLWTPLRVRPTDTSLNYTVISRLADGVSPAQAATDLARLKQEIPRDLRGISEARSQALRWISYREWLGLESRDALLLLLGAVVLLLVIACVNVASLQLVRAVARRREMATRSALGGGAARLFQQVLTESVLLALGGAAVGVVVAPWGVHTLLTLVPAGLLEGRTVNLDWRALSVTLAVAVAAGIFFGLVPALVARRVDLRTALWESARNTAGRPAMWLRRGFATAEVALAVVLLVGAGLFVRTFVNMQTSELGFDPSNVVIGKMSLQGSTGQTQEHLATFFERSLARLRDLSGVSAAAVGNNIPVERGLNLAVEPPEVTLVERMRAVDWRYVTAEYFILFGIPLRAGRVFDERDHAQSAAVVVVNEAFAHAYFGTTRVLGRFVQLARDLRDSPREIVGVVADVKGLSGSGWTRGLNALSSPVAPAMYVPAAQVPDNIMQLVHRFFPISWAVRTSRPGEAVTAVHDVIRSTDPRLPFIRFETMEQVIARDLEMQRFLTTLLGVFAAVSLALATVGIYGLVAYAVSQRTQEVGIRMALGATRATVLSAFLQEGLALVALGLALGLSGAAFAGRLVRSLVFGVEPLDPLTFAVVSATLVVVTGVATLMPALQASRTDPLQALRLD
jgi:putative ABC transport system permease protein